MADVLVFTDADAQLVQQIGGELVASQPQATTAISHEQVVHRLDELGVNLSRVLVGGALTCQVTLQNADQSTTDGASTGDAAPLWRRPRSTAIDGDRTLAYVLRSHVSAELSELGGTAELDFERAGQEFLELTTPPWEFSISSASRDKLGLREFRVAIRRAGRVQRTAHVFAHVRLVRKVVVARRPLGIGNYVRRDDVELETRVFDSGVNLGLAQLEQVVGQQVKRFVPIGEMVCTEAIQATDLVRRSRPVTVTGDGSSVQVRLTGMALDSGSYGDTVRVRMGASRGQRRVLRGVVTGLGTVRLAEGNL